MNWRSLLSIVSVFVLLLSGCASEEPNSTAAGSETAPQGTDGPSETEAAGSTVPHSVEGLLGLWILTSAPGLEDGLGSMLSIFDGPELGDRYIQLTAKDGSCINWHDYEHEGEILKTGDYLGEVTLEECLDPGPGFAALLQDGSEVRTTVSRSTLQVEAAGFTLGFERTTDNLYDEFIFQSSDSETATFDFVMSRRNGDLVPSGDPDFPEFRLQVLSAPQPDGSVVHLIKMWNTTSAGNRDCATHVLGTASGLLEGQPSSLELGVLPPDWEFDAGPECPDEPRDPKWQQIFAGEFDLDYAPNSDHIEVNFGDDKRAFFAQVQQ